MEDTYIFFKTIHPSVFDRDVKTELSETISAVNTCNIFTTDVRVGSRIGLGAERDVDKFVFYAFFFFCIYLFLQ